MQTVESDRSNMSICRKERLSRLQCGAIAGLALWLACAAAGCDEPKSAGNNPAPAASIQPNSANPPDSPQRPEKPEKPAKPEKVVVATKPEPYLKDWSAPAATLVFTGEIHGYLEPCGCSLKQSGGFARRAEFLDELTAKKWPFVGLDVGGTLKKSNRQDEIKFESILIGMQQMNYSTLALGPEELLLGADFLLSQHLTDDPKAVSFLGANVVLYETPQLGTPRPWKLIQVGDVKIGVTAVLGLSHKDLVSPPGVMNNISVVDPASVLPGVIDEMQAAKADLLVLLSHGTVEEAKKLAADFPQFRIIQTAGGPDEASGKPIIVNDTMILETGVKGRSIGVVGYYPDDAQKPFRFELIELDSERFPGGERMTPLMRNYQQRLQDEGIAASDKLKLPHPSGWAFVGAETCGECHVKTYEHWRTTGHFKGFETLLHGRGTEKEWVPRQFDPECLSCHVTGWEPQQMKRFESGYVTQDASLHLLGQQCENCHGPGSRHVELERAFAENEKSVAKPNLEELREALRLSFKTAEKKVCIQCHDAENSPGFTYDEAWEKVKHPWKD